MLFLILDRNGTQLGFAEGLVRASQIKVSMEMQYIAQGKNPEDIYIKATLRG